MNRRSQEQIQYTLATHGIEQLEPSEAALRLCEQMAERKLSADAAVSELLKQYGLEHE